MKTKRFFVAVLAALLAVSAFAQDAKPQLKWYGFIRNYYAFDTRESVAGSEDFFYYLPKDTQKVGDTDLNAETSMRFAALTSRLGVDIVGYEYEGLKVGAKIEGDFYCGLTGVTGTATFRLRQAYLTLAKDSWALKAGQAWHPLAADMPDIFSLNTGAPFGPFTRTPLVQFDAKFSDVVSLTAAALWQMQYVSAGPEGASANYIKYGKTPELYAGLNFKGENTLFRVGVDMLSIKPRKNNGIAKVSDRITTITPFFYAQYKKDLFAAKFKAVFAEDGSHMNLNGGYGISKVSNDGSCEYTPTRNFSTWASLSYGKKVQGVLFLGYAKNFGTKDELAGELYFSKNSFANLNQMFRLTPTIIYNIGKVALGLECEITSAQYGDKAKGMNAHGLYTEGLHNVTNCRLQGMLKYTF